MPDLRERITQALYEAGEPSMTVASHLADAVLVVLSERDNQIREHLEAMHSNRCRYVSIGSEACSVSPGYKRDQWCYACDHREHREAALLLLGANQETPDAEPWKCPKCRCQAGCVCCSPIECYCTESTPNTAGPFGV